MLLSWISTISSRNWAFEARVIRTEGKAFCLECIQQWSIPDTPYGLQQLKQELKKLDLYFIPFCLPQHVFTLVTS